MPTFIPGLALSEMFFLDLVQPLVDRRFPDLCYAAGRFGAGSDVLGYDTARSMDHDWGPRLQILLAEDDFHAWQTRLDALFRQSLPATFQGFPTRYGRHEADGTFHMELAGDDPSLPHLIDISTVRRRFGGVGDAGVETANWVRIPEAWIEVAAHAGDGNDSGFQDPATWLTIPEQCLLEMTSGRIFRDDSGHVSRLRERLAWYPRDVWRSKMAAQWMRIDQFEPFVGRCGEVGDDLGSQVVAMTLVRDVMRMAFLMERQYAPYPKWFGTAFSRLPLAAWLAPGLDAARFATTWQEREAGVVAAVTALAEHHNTMELTEWVDPEPRMFHSRPFRVMFSGRFAAALMASVRDPEVLALPLHLGGLDQFMDSTDAFNCGGLHLAIREWMDSSQA